MLQSRVAAIIRQVEQTSSFVILNASHDLLNESKRTCIIILNKTPDKLRPFQFASGCYHSKAKGFTPWIGTARFMTSFPLGNNVSHAKSAKITDDLPVSVILSPCDARMSSVIPLIDHAVLHPTQTESDLVAACKLCRDLGAFSVCVKPYMIPSAVKLLAGSKTIVSTVIGFPHGSPPTAIKAAEARWTCEQGAKELDMVINVGQAQQKQWDEVEADIRAVVDVGREFNVITKVIFETDYFPSDEHKIELCKASERAGAAFVKTSTGFGFVKQPDGSMATRAQPITMSR